MSVSDTGEQWNSKRLTTHCPFWQNLYAPTALERWNKEGLPDDIHIGEYFGFEPVGGVPVNLGIVPGFKVETIKVTAFLRELGKQCLTR